MHNTKYTKILAFSGSVFYLRTKSRKLRAIFAKPPSSV